MPPPNPTLPTPATWTRRLQSGDMIELSYECGWWEVQFLSRSGSTLRVLATRYGKVHEVSSAGLRPGWRCGEGEVWDYALGGVFRTGEEWAANIAANPGRAKAPAKRSSMTDGADGIGAGPEKRSRRESTSDPLAQLATSSGFVGPGIAEGAPVAALEPGEVGCFKWGVAVEIMSNEERLNGCWCPAEVLRVLDNELNVAWIADADPPNATAAVERARPAAPAPPAGWAANLRPGEPVDLYHDGAWWAVLLESRKGLKAKVADGPDDPLPREVKLSALRPRYTWLGWEGGWKYVAEGRECFIPPGPAPLSHNVPSSGAEAAPGPGQTSKGRTIKPKGGAGADLARTQSLVPLVDPERVPKLGELLEVEVAEPEESGGGVDWKPAEVVQLVARQRFMAMVNGEEDFIEEYGMEDEGKEWRKVQPEDLERVARDNEAAKAADAEARRLQAERDLAEAAAIAAAGGGEGGEAAAAEGGGGKAKGKKKSGEGGEGKVSGKSGGGKAAGGSSYRFGFGMEVEVRVRDKGYEGSWYAAEVLSSKEDGSCVVAFDGLYEAPPAGNPVGPPVQETCRADSLRPKPPTSPEGWSDKLSPGTPLELNHEDGWWQVSYVSKLVGTEQVLVKSTHWGSQHLVQLSSLRPGWRWSPISTEWTIKGAAGGGGGARGGGGGGGGNGGASSTARGGGGPAGRGARAMGGRAMGRGRGRGKS